MNEILHQPGFLGTSANFAADMTLLIMIVGAGIFTYGGYVMRKYDDFDRHKRIQTVGAILNIIMVAWLMILPFRDFVVRDLGGPREALFYNITRLHALTGAVAIIFGWFVVLRGYNLMIGPLKFNNYKPFMRVAYGLYIAATILGVLVYIVWFIVEPNTPSFG